MTIFVATSDVHAPRYLGLMSLSLKALEREGVEPCFVILAGDLTDKGRTSLVGIVFNYVRRTWRDKAVIAVFGNEEYHNIRPLLKIMYQDVIWLDDETSIIECDGVRVAIVGTSGALDEPTRWQARNMPWIAREYMYRPARIARLIREARSSADRVIVVSHYGLSKETLRGEDPKIWKYLYSSSMEKVIASEKPDIAVHGHAHKGSPRACVSGVPVYNVALPLNKALVVIDLESKCSPR